MYCYQNQKNRINRAERSDYYIFEIEDSYKGDVYEK